jgi:glycosidase
LTARRRRASRKAAKKSAARSRSKRRSSPRAASRRRAKAPGWLWWRDGVVYQIYPRSYMDSNGDGIGDLEGIRRRLDHLAWLGVDALWLSPCFPSPMADFGYDVADYCDIDPRFGTLGDFDRLLADAHARGLRVLLDLVPNHSSSEHPWFQESRASRNSPKRDWYVWRDPVDGKPPNNWLGCFGGPAWSLDAATGQYYLHSFLPEQPDLNWRSPAVVRAMHDVVRFWFERGVDGFRIDVVHRIAKDPKLRDNPVIDPAHGFGGQRHVHDENHPDVHRLLRGLRRIANRYPERAYVGEVYLMNPAEVARYYGRNDELHLAFNFSFLNAPWSAAAFRRESERFQNYVGRRGWPDHVLSSHDAPRHASRYDHPTLGDARARLAAAMLLTLRGTPFLYQGEEIGMRNVPVPEDRLQDPLAFRLHPKLSRDPSRTPMPWEPGPGAGFTNGEPWLPIGADAALRNVAAQRNEPGSLLHLYRALLALRRRTPALHRGAYAARRAPKDVFAFERSEGGQRAVVALNFGDASALVSLGRGRVADGLHTRPGAALPERLGRVELGPCEGIVAVLA